MFIHDQKSDFSPAHAGSDHQRTLQTKYVAAYETQRFQYFTRPPFHPLEI